MQHYVKLGEIEQLSWILKILENSEFGGTMTMEKAK